MRAGRSAKVVHSKRVRRRCCGDSPTGCTGAAVPAVLVGSAASTVGAVAGAADVVVRVEPLRTGAGGGARRVLIDAVGLTVSSAAMGAAAAESVPAADLAPDEAMSWLKGTLSSAGDDTLGSASVSP